MATDGTNALFESLLNFRDVAESINAYSGKQTLRTGFLFRSARPDESTASDRTRLRDSHGIKTVIDLRSKTEHINAAKKYSDAVAIAQSSAVPASNDWFATPLRIPGLEYVEISLTGRAFERALLWKLSWSSMAKLVSLMLLGYRTQAISILGSEVMQPRGLIGLGIDTLDCCQNEIRDIFLVLAESKSYPILIHCTQGKDRTGLIVLLVLLLCGADSQAISKDYLQSQQDLQPEMAERMKEIASIGLDASFAGCPEDFVPAIVQHLDRSYGGTANYLNRVGLTGESQTKIKNMLMV